MRVIDRTERSDGGLGSLQGIRWLLAVGSLVLSVSVFRLVESQWDLLPTAAQFVALALGTFAVFAAAELVRYRLRLPMAGSALQLLFVTLLPVLSWGAGYLELVETPAGSATFVLSMGVLLYAMRRTLKRAIGYHGLLYPAAFGAFTVALPWVARLGEDAAASTDIGLPLAVATASGALFYVGSVHINRFLFHRDRRDGKDRPVTALPFLALSVLYGASVSLSGLPLAWISLPLAVMGAALVATGEEYYRALVNASHGLPDSWPRRSMALLSVGFGLIAVSGPLGFLEGSGRAAALTLALGSTLLVRWGSRYEKRWAHLGGIGAAVVAFQLVPAWLPGVVIEPVLSLLDRYGLGGELAATSLAHLALALVFHAVAPRLKDELQKGHAILTSVHVAGVVMLSLTDLTATRIVSPIAFAILAAAIGRTRRFESLTAAYFAFGVAVLAWASDGVLTPEALRSLAVALTFVAWLAPRHWLGPAPLLWAAAIGVMGLARFGGGGSLELLLASGLAVALGQRQQRPAVAAIGLLALSLGLHGELAIRFEASRLVLVSTNLILFTGSVLLDRWAKKRPLWSLGASVFLVAHGVLGLGWLLTGVVSDVTTIEPLILALFGLAVIWESLRTSSKGDVTFGLSLLLSYPSLHLWTVGWLTSLPLALMVSLAAGLVVSFAVRGLGRTQTREALEAGLGKLLSVWNHLAVPAALVFSGLEGFALAGLLVVMGARTGTVPHRRLLLFLLQAVAWLHAAGSEFLPLALVDSWRQALPLAAPFALGWLVLVERTASGEERARLQLWTVVVELSIVLGLLGGVLPPTAYSPWHYGALVATALGFALRHGTVSARLRSSDHAWAMQAWLGLAGLTALGAGWITFGSGRAPYLLLAFGAAQYGLAALWKRTPETATLASSALSVGQALAFAGGAVAAGRAFDPLAGEHVWVPIAPLFLASLFFLLVASRERQRWLPGLLTSSSLGTGLLAVAWAQGIGREFYSLAPGLSLVLLARVLSNEMGPRWSRHVFTAGAAFIYATPVLALYHEITWGWQAILLLVTVGFGACSFQLRSRALLTVSTAALAVDLACFVIKIRATEPVLLWVGGLLLGVGLLALAAYLEHRREGIAQRLRLFGRELSYWY